MTHFGSTIFGLDGSAVDIDGDGHEDLVISGVQGTGKAFVWFGGSIPVGAVTAPAAPFIFSAPATFGVTGSCRAVARGTHAGSAISTVMAWSMRAGRPRSTTAVTAASRSSPTEHAGDR